MASEQATKAAGGVVWRKRPPSGRVEPRVDLLLIHRPSYDDWSFPKGKTDDGESLQATATREIAEETGARVRLGHPLGELSYPVAGGLKSVTYWSARAVGETEPFVPNKEVDEIRWVGVREARKLLTYDHDRILLKSFVDLLDSKAHRSRTLIVQRHGKAAARSADIDDLERPLTSVGSEQAQTLAPILAAYGVGRVISSPALRCAQTVEPYAHSISTFIEIDDRIGEDTTFAQVQRSVAATLDRKRPVVLCTHRPTLPWIFEAIGTESYDLAPGEGVVIHHRKGTVFAVEKLA
ncbi:8-oxo-dGTP diphosphatase [Aeromicrobium panaciterrae]|uniref:8-oxo-dGTP diphosphatase n=1 Tax=Aeromicrobium panaciterrae TaxID=363861 RepID=A0ABU1UL62_9ACTN|nr:NUDIX hydrolase [Aeromicrobium panaciterrae]MDR7085912.1 8-oxo-dGTP diphosphatase [Aeromicrobium panaciterrae]